MRVENSGHQTNEHRTNEHGPNEAGAAMMEYVLIICCLLLVVVSSVGFVGAETRDTFHEVGRKLAHSNFPADDFTVPVIPD